MKLAVVGVGGAGSRVVNQILEREQATGRNLCNGNTLLVDSSGTAFDATEHVPSERRLVVGDVRWDDEAGAADGGPDRMAAVAREERHEINRAFDHLEFHQVDGVLVTAGLAGATGGGVGVVVLDRLSAIYDGPVYAVGVLPSEAEGRRSALNAARSLRSFVERADNVVAFDNDAWLPDDAPDADATDDETSETAGEATTPDASAGDYATVNETFAERLVALFAAGEFSGGAAPETRLDPSDVMRVLDTGGVSSVGYAATEVAQPGGVRAWLRDLIDLFSGTADPGSGDETSPTDAARTNRLLRRAARSKLTLPCEVSSADRALVVLSGPPEALSRKGFESGRYWLEGEADVVDVMAGDVPHDRTGTLTAVVLFANVTDVPRIDRMQETATEDERSAEAGSRAVGRADGR